MMDPLLGMKKRTMTDNQPQTLECEECVVEAMGRLRVAAA